MGTDRPDPGDMIRQAQLDFRNATVEAIVSEGRAFGLSDEAARELAKRVARKLSGCPTLNLNAARRGVEMIQARE